MKMNFAAISAARRAISKQILLHHVDQGSENRFVYDPGNWRPELSFSGLGSNSIPFITWTVFRSLNCQSRVSIYLTTVSCLFIFCPGSSLLFLFFPR